MVKIILASKSKVRKQILDKNNIITKVQNSNLDEDIVKESLLKERATPELISKNLAELKIVDVPADELGEHNEKTKKKINSRCNLDNWTFRFRQDYVIENVL